MSAAAHRRLCGCWLTMRMQPHALRTAFEVGGHAVTYEQLLGRSLELADRLAVAVEPGKAVLVLAPRTQPATVELMLALWHAHLTPILCDSDVPAVRLAELRHALAPAGVIRHVGAGSGQTRSCSLSDHWLLERCLAGSEFPYGCPDPAYIIATSGSSGEPRAVLCRHTGLRHQSEVLVKALRYSTSSRVLQFAPPSYDAMVAEAILPLVAGSTLVFPDGDGVQPPGELTHTILSRRITHVTLPPTVLRRLAPFEAPNCTIVSAGERLDPDLAQRLRACCARLVNAYGPCEATIAATVHEVTAADTDAVPIGRPLPGLTVTAVQASEGLECLTINGPTVAWGYIANARLVRGPMTGFEGSSRFVTADLVRTTASGAFVFEGRADRQVKRFGHRVELSLVERQLLALDAVRDCAVVADGPAMHAFVVGGQPDRQQLSAKARAHLRPWELPTHWHFLDVLPQLSSDKVDLQHLSTLAGHLPVTAAPPAADPEVAEVWLQFVTASRGAESDFFSEGGDSLAALELAVAVEQAFGVTLDLSSFIEAPTLGALTRAVRS